MTLEIITSDALGPIRHGFFTRKGGASSGVYAGLNCGYGSSDQSDIVRINRTRVAEAMDVELDDLAGVHQVHSTVVLPVTEAPQEPRPKADAMVTATPGVALGVLTADCQPILFADADAGVIGAAHAGWKGARDGIVEATLKAMSNLGAEIARITAVIGPTISQRNYEVGPEFYDDFVIDDPEAARFFAGGEGDRMHFDLPLYTLTRLRQAGVKEAEWTHHCTYAEPELFFSYRRSTHLKEADYGRLISVIRL